MDHFSKLTKQIELRLFAGMLFAAVAIAGTYAALQIFTPLDELVVITGTSVIGVLLLYILSGMMTATSLAPLKIIWQAVLHIDPDHQGTRPPNLDELRIGRELVSSLTLQIYQFASQHNSKDLVEHRREISQAANIVDNLPLPLFVFNKQQLVTNASRSALEYCKLESSELFGKPLFDALHLEFPNERTLETWVADCEANKITDTAYWERVHVLSKEDNSLIRQCDIAAFYSKDNPSGTEFIVTLFDRTERYTEDDDELSFVSLAVHELRTPITMLRGYIEVFEDELGDNLNDELRSFMMNMEASAKRLSIFVSNILNVARIEQNQLALHLTEERWSDVLEASISDAELRAKVRGKTIEYNIDENIPTVAVDRVSIYEVINNLLENAVKYSGASERIIVSSSKDKDGNVQTTVQDFGVGIPSSVLPNLFEKFSRNHRTKAEVSGTGLGLYLSKAIINAHGGQIWASSKEGEGSTFGFTLIPYDQLSAEQKVAGNKEITRSANGWIKNHSLYRR